MTYCGFGLYYFFFFKQKTAYEMRISDWSSDVCSSDLLLQPDIRHQQVGGEQAGPQPPPEMPAVAALGRPPRALQRVDVEHQEHAEDAEVVVDVAEVDNAARDRLDAPAAHHKLHRIPAPVPEPARPPTRQQEGDRTT